jgi:hypothetical protein
MLCCDVALIQSGTGLLSSNVRSANANSAATSGVNRGGVMLMQSGSMKGKSTMR